MESSNGEVLERIHNLRKLDINITDDILEAIECPVCLEPMSAEHKVLPCQHTFCLSCLYDAKGKKETFLCPECRISVDASLDHLPTNIILNRVLSALLRLAVQHDKTALLPIDISSTKKPASIIEMLKPLKISPIVPTYDFGSKNPFIAITENEVLTYSASEAPLPGAAQGAETSPGWPNEIFPEMGRSNSETDRPTPDSMNRPSSVPPRIPPPLSSGPATKLPELPPRPGVTHQVHRALYDYKPKKPDELELEKGQLYMVTEKCADGWLKGSCLKSLKIGVFPGNYVQLAKNDKPVLPPPKRTQRSTSVFAISSSEPRSSNLIDFSEFDELFGTVQRQESSRRKSLEHLPNSSMGAVATSVDPSTQPSSPEVVNGAAAIQTSLPVGVIPPRVPRYVAIQSFPASSDFELDLQIGDVIQVTKIRRDGWCKGFHERTGKAGLFPISFVTKKP